jgi:hypothetical protein
MSNVSWYNPRLHYANFIVLDSQPGNFSYFEPYEYVRRFFGTPSRTYETGPYTIMVWNRNLLDDLPHTIPSSLIAPGQPVP